MNHEDMKDTKILQGETTHLVPLAVYECLGFLMLKPGGRERLSLSASRYHAKPLLGCELADLV